MMHYFIANCRLIVQMSRQNNVVVRHASFAQITCCTLMQFLYFFLCLCTTLLPVAGD